MQNSLQITVRGMDPSPAMEQRIREKAAHLERFADRITSCHVTVEAPHRHHQQGNLYSVHVDIRVPNRQLVFGRNGRDHAHEDVYVAIRDAFDAAARGLESYVRDRRDH